MTYTIKCYYGNKIEEIIHDGSFDDFARKKVKEYKLFYKNDENYYHKIMWNYDEGESFDGEVRCYRMLKDSGLVPKYVEGKILCTLEASTGDYYEIIKIAMIKTETCGKSLLDLYIPKDLREKYCGPGEYIHHLDTIRDDIKYFFPEKYIPATVFDKVVKILNTLVKKYGIEHDDIHPGNFLEKDGKIYVIDFGCVSFRHNQ